MSDVEQLLKNTASIADSIEENLNEVTDTEQRQELEQIVRDMRSKIEKRKQLLDREKAGRKERLSELFDKANGKTKANLARFCDVTSAAVAFWVRNGAFTYDNAVKIATYFGVNPEWLFTGKGEKYAPNINPTVETVADRFAVLNIEIHRGDKWWKISNLPAPVAFNIDYLGSEAIFADHCRLIRVQGDRMAPTIKAGEFLLINQAEKNIISGLTYLVSVNGELLLCQIYRSADGIRLHYDNTNYPDEEFTSETMTQISVIGRVVMSVRQF